MKGQRKTHRQAVGTFHLRGLKATCVEASQTPLWCEGDSPGRTQLYGILKGLVGGRQPMARQMISLPCPLSEVSVTVPWEVATVNRTCKHRSVANYCVVSQQL